MGLYKYLSKLHRERPESLQKLERERMIIWRSETAIKRIEHPTNLNAAKKLGYKAKQGIILVRIRISRGGKERPTIRKGRRSAHMRQRLVLKKSYHAMAEARVTKDYPNLEVLNSYKVGKDGLYSWYEVILVDPQHPAIINDSTLGWIASGKHKGRAYRGLTSAGKKSRGLMYKGQGTEKLRPSLKANDRRGK